MKNILATLLIAAAVSSNAQSQLPVKKVTIFKNATGMFLKEGNAPVKNGIVSMPIPQKVLFGSYFIGASKDNSIKNILFKNDTIHRPDKSRSVWQYLAGNLNKTVTIYYSPTDGIDKSATGKAVDYDLYSGILKFVTEKGNNLVMHAGKIYEADFKEDPSPTYMADSFKRMMILKPEKPANDIALQEIYMSSGINWLPSYYLKLKDDKTARLEMKATVENYAEEIRDAEVELVVGSPQMSKSGVNDPMTYDYITSAVYDNSGSYNYKQANYMQANAYAGSGAEIAADGFFDSDFNTQGEKLGDMYIYKPGKISVPNSSKGTFPIFASTVEYKDKYEGTISDITNYYSMKYCAQEEKTFDVFHSLEIKNNSSVPLTTASVMVVNDKDQFVAQDEIKYCPVGSETNVRLSKAIDVVMKNSEEEKSREDNAKKIGKVNYSKVLLKGTINIDNFQKKEVTITITKSLSGTVTASNSNKVTKKNSYNYINPSTEIKWEVKLGANDKKVLTYEYEVFFTP